MTGTSATVRVELTERSSDRGYDIQIGRNLLGDAARRCVECTPLQHVIVITDDNVSPIYGETVHRQFVTSGIAADLLSVPAGESSKSIEVATRLWTEILAGGTTRESTIVAVGGGMVGDLAGFVAASFARGLNFIQIPTTLLAQVDSSVGGKVAINLPSAKNMVGFFWQPKLVLADLDALDTLPQREYVAGLAEVVKYGMIADPSLFAQLESEIDSILTKDKSVLQSIVARCCQIKARVVREDERETTGRRAALNYGHTIGHALESIAGYGQLLHGEAIAIGMHCAAILAAERKMIPEALVARQAHLLSAFGLPISAPEVDALELWKVVVQDKKTDASGVRFILPNQLGNVQFVEGIDEPAMKAALRASMVN